MATKYRSGFKKRRWAINLKRDTKKCTYCSNEFTERNIKTFEHVQPLVLGGSHNEQNIIVVCYRCNMKRGMQPLEEFLNNNNYWGQYCGI